MFKSFFPRPRNFFLSALAWFALLLAIWHVFAVDHPDLSLIQIPVVEVAEGERAPFLSTEKVWVYQFIIGGALLFCLFWLFWGRNKWYIWSVVGTAIILVVTYFLVQISVWLNTWYGDFYDLIQDALGNPGSVTLAELFGKMLTVSYVLMATIMVQVVFQYYTQHYVFRWRMAMNEYYTEHWQKLRHVEGAAQRVQEDTMRFAGIMENLGSAFISSVMTLLAFFPLLWELSSHITELPFIGPVKGSMVFVALVSAMLGTVLLAVVGIRLPGLEFHNQRVEAAYRKELVYGEDNAERASPPVLSDLFSDVRRNYFRLYFNYLYFNVFRYAYLQGANFIPLIAMGPTIVAGAITLGIFTQINNAFGKVENSFQFLVNSWTTIIELISIHKRLTAFESVLDEDQSLTSAAI
ncbi:microcin B17 transporter [Chromatiales bacterium (ex Bugula neritina AB1)]|nr:microcin B17 transporter [Chromatiales bacterium (ex Bugula neritina AB1)]